jgi:hypothetical protein
MNPAPFIRSRRIPTILLALLPAAAAPLRAQDSPPSDWPAELHPLLSLYYDGAYSQLEQTLRQVESGSIDPRIRREAAALSALLLLRSPERLDRLDGRARLAQVSNDDPALALRPECRWALGVAALALNETGLALDHLDAAVRGFELLKQPGRRAEALADLGSAWLRHNDWEQTPAHLNVAAPADPHAAAELRRARAAAVRAQLAALGDYPEPLARLDLRRAEELCADADAHAEGLALLEQLASRPVLTRSTAEATLALADHYERRAQPEDALRLYDRLAAAPFGDLAIKADERRRAIREPRCQIDAPAHSAPGRRVAITLRTRNLTQAALEVRLVDLPRWLRERQGRLIESNLPSSGSLVFSRELDPRGGSPHAWWSSADAGESLAFEGAPGAYAILGQTTDDQGRPFTYRKLVIVSDLSALALAGPTRGVVWCNPADEQVEFTAWFWMFGSFVPREFRWRGPVGRFELPPDARVMQERRWVLLVQRGDALAVCQGRLESAASAPPARLAAALTASPPAARAGDTLTLAGLLLQNTPAPWPPIRIELSDALNRKLLDLPVEVSAAGAFSVAAPILPEYGGKHLRVLVRSAGRVVENIRGRLLVRVASDNDSPLEVTPRSPPRVAPDAEVPFAIAAHYPWGTPAAHAKSMLTVHGLRLPSTTDWTFGYSSPFSRWKQTDAAGGFDFRVAASELQLAGAPLLCGVWTSVFSSDRRTARAASAVLIGDSDSHAWLELTPPQPPVGEPLQISLGWCDPSGAWDVLATRLQLLGPAGERVDLPLFGGPSGLVTEPWTPPAAGAWRAVATLRRWDGAEPETSVERPFEVAPPAPGAADAVALSATRTSRDGVTGAAVRVQVGAPALSAPPLLVVTGAGEPLALTPCPSGPGPHEVFLPLPDAPPSDAAVLLLAAQGFAAQVLATAPLAERGPAALALELDPPQPDLGPDGTATVRVRLTGDGALDGASIIARLIDAGAERQTVWTPAPAGSAENAESSKPVRTDAAAELAAVARRPLDLPLRDAAALYSGATLWTTVAPFADGAASIRAPIPPTAGRYRLLLLARTGDGRSATAAATIDARAQVQALLEVPALMLVGDRGVGSIRLRGGERGGRVRLALALGEGLALESARGPDGAVVDFSRPPEVELAPRQELAWRLQLEAGRPAHAAARVELTGAALERTASQNYTVLTADGLAPGAATSRPGAATPPIRLVRTLLRLRPRAPADLPPPAPGDIPFVTTPNEPWDKIPLSPGEALIPGDLVMVREEFRLARPVAEIEWRQIVPSNCFSVITRPEEAAGIGPVTRRDLHSITWSAPNVPAGERVHEYVITAVRPGVASLPPPQISQMRDALAVEVDSLQFAVREPRGP